MDTKQLPIVDHPEIFETFADSLAGTTFDGSTLRMEFTVARWEGSAVAAQPTAKRHISCRLVLTAPCAIELFNRMQHLSAALAQAGKGPGGPATTK